MIVAITGANGFIGRHLVRDQLEKGRFVRAVDQEVDGLEDLSSRQSLEVIRADICDQEPMRQALQDVSVVFHLAAAHLSRRGEETEYRKINVDGTLQFVRLACDCGVSRFVHCSSVGVYGTILSPPADEETPCNPENLYERTKWAGEQAVRRFAEEKGYPVVVVRPTWVYGPGCPRTEMLFRMVLSRRFLYFGDGTNRRHCIYIADMVRAFDAVSSLNITPGRVYICGDPHSVRLVDVIETIAQVAGVPAPRRKIPLWVGALAATSAEWITRFMGIEAPLSRRTLRFFDGNYDFDVSRARRELGFETRFTLYEGLRLTHEFLESDLSGSNSRVA